MLAEERTDTWADEKMEIFHITQHALCMIALMHGCPRYFNASISLLVFSYVLTVTSHVVVLGLRCM